MLLNRAIVFKRAQSLNNGISVSWLEQTWTPSIIDSNGIKRKDMELLRKLGFTTIRLPVAFAYFDAQHVPLEKVLARIDAVMAQCNKYGFKLIIDYHYGNLNDNNYEAETQVIIKLWAILTRHYLKESPDNLFFELYNEPPRSKSVV